MCREFPELCRNKSDETKPVYEHEHEHYAMGKFATSADLHKAICSADSVKFCRGKDEINIFDVCANAADLPKEVQAESGILTVCLADLPKMCSDPALKPLVCPDGQNLSKNLCPALPAEACAMPAAATTAPIPTGTTFPDAAIPTGTTFPVAPVTPVEPVSPEKSGYRGCAQDYISCVTSRYMNFV
mmetsp:Transcript_52/g.76  ORF Transcript_52/g.76 Transcript_52/m.76 type:complete len:186 (-) Transcript_52:965-1522(-)